MTLLSITAIVYFRFILESHVIECSMVSFVHKDYKSPDEQTENFTKQPVDKYRKISFCNLCKYFY